MKKESGSVSNILRDKISETIKNKNGELELRYKPEFNEKGEIILKEKSKIRSGKLARAAGARFELRVRKEWEDKGFILDKWTNNVDLEAGRVTPAKRKYNPFRKALVIGTGFPDFIAVKPLNNGLHEVIGIEVKMNGLLSKEEKEKARWYLENNVFSKILVAKKSEVRGEVEHIDFSEKWGEKSK